jgi:chaperonin cofactor prefoldin
LKKQNDDIATKIEDGIESTNSKLDDIEKKIENIDDRFDDIENDTIN